MEFWTSIVAHAVPFKVPVDHKNFVVALNLIGSEIANTVMRSSFFHSLDMSEKAMVID